MITLRGNYIWFGAKIRTKTYLNQTIIEIRAALNSMILSCIYPLLTIRAANEDES